MERTTSSEYQPEMEVRRLSQERMAHVGTVQAFDLDAQAMAFNGGEQEQPPELVVDIGAATSDFDLSHIEEIPERKRVRIDINAVSAWVPSLFGQPSLLQRLNPLRLLRRGAKGGGGVDGVKLKMNQVGAVELPDIQRHLDMPCLRG